ncbi:MAG: hypothetical protein KDK38_10570 [Leptospiraceae bacterium]|nr:hypothetical protein [Leptospiraceae bacterium]
MVVTEVETIIHCSLEEAFEYIINLENHKHYNYSVRSAKNLPNNDLPTAELEISLSILNFKGRYTVIDLEKNRNFTAVCRLPNLMFEDQYFFDKRAEGFSLKIIDKLQLNGLLKLSEPIVGSFLKDGMQRNLQTLKNILEKNETNKFEQ